MSEKISPARKRFTDAHGIVWQVAKQSEGYWLAFQPGAKEKARPFTMDDLRAMKEHEYPREIRIGDLVIFGGQPAIVTMFPCADAEFLGVSGLFGGETITQQCFAATGSCLKVCFQHGIRWPFEGEVSEAERLNLVRLVSRDPEEDEA